MKKLDIKSILICIILSIVFFVNIYPMVYKFNEKLNEEFVRNELKQQNMDDTFQKPSFKSKSLYRYKTQTTGHTFGKPFNVTRNMLSLIKFPLTNFITLNAKNAESFVFLTAADWKYYPSTTHMLSTIHRHFPNKTIYFYDIGLTESQHESMSKVCNVIMRDFRPMIKELPYHVGRLKRYAWKPLIIHDLLRTESGIFYIDSSARFLSSDMSVVVEKTIDSTNGFLFFVRSPHSNYAVTNRGTYEYLPTNTTAMKIIRQRGANTMLIYRTKDVYENIIQWFVLCALDADCIMPSSSKLGCNFKSDTFTEYANCHRFDQSVVNILVNNYLNFCEGSLDYTPDPLEGKPRLLRLLRGAKDSVDMEMCE